MKAIATHAPLEQGIRQPKALGDRLAAPVEAGIETGYLKQIKVLRGRRPDRGQTMRLVQGDQRNQPGQGLDHPGVDGHGLGIGLATVGDPVTDGEHLPTGDGVFEPVPNLLEGRA